MARAHERFTVSLFALDFSGVIDRRRIRNISSGGMFVECPQPLPSGTEVTLAIALPSGGEVLLASAEVVHPASDGMGLKFRPLPDRDRELLETYLQEL